jgi:hypothetical protein
MQWVVFSYFLRGKSRSSPRVALWRRLKRLGSIPLGGIQVLPEREDCVEAFTWLAQEIRQAGGEAVVARVQQFVGLTDAALIQLFQASRGTEYEELDAEAATLEHDLSPQERTNDRLEHLRRRYADLARIDYFQCPVGTRVAGRLARIEQALSAHPPMPEVPVVSPEAYRNRHWVTRPHPHVDRLACIWLIRRFIDPRAIVRYALEPEPGEIAFDMDQDEFGHRGTLCTFETMRIAFGLADPVLHIMAEIVHEIDLQDGQFERLETPGIMAVLDGWRQADYTDEVLEAQGTTLFEGLYTALISRASGP